MRRPWLLLLTLVACSKVTRPVAPAPAPDSLIAIVETPSIEGAVKGLGDYADAVKRGSRAFITPTMITMAAAQTAGATDLEGIDASAPARLLVLDPKRFDPPCVVLVKVKDQAALKKSLGQATLRRQGAWGIVGSAKAVKEVEGYALGTLAREAPANHPKAVVFVPALWKSYRTEAEKLRQQLAKTFAAAGALDVFMGRYFDLLFGMIDQTARVEVTLDIDARTGELDLVFRPRPGTTFEAFTAAQEPFDPALFDRLPSPQRLAMLAAGSFHLGPLRKPAEALLAEMAPHEPKIIEGVSALLDQLEGDFVMAMDLAAPGTTSVPAPRAVALYTAKDSKAVLAGAKAMVGLFGNTKMTFDGTSMGFDAQIKEGVIDGTPWFSYSLVPKPEGLPPQQQANLEAAYANIGATHTAAVDGALLAVMGGGGLEELKANLTAIRAGRTGGLLDGARKQIVDEAHQRKDTAIVLFDFGAMMGGAASSTPMRFTIGFQEKSLRIRFIVPPAAISTAVQPQPT